MPPGVPTRNQTQTRRRRSAARLCWPNGSGSGAAPETRARRRYVKVRTCSSGSSGLKCRRMTSCRPAQPWYLRGGRRCGRQRARRRPSRIEDSGAGSHPSVAGSDAWGTPRAATGVLALGAAEQSARCSPHQPLTSRSRSARAHSDRPSSSPPRTARASSGDVSEQRCSKAAMRNTRRRLVARQRAELGACMQALQMHLMCSLHRSASLRRHCAHVLMGNGRRGRGRRDVVVRHQAG